MRTLALLTNGGDTCSLNAVIKSIRDNALKAGYTRVLAFKDGFKGINDGILELLTWFHIDERQGGTILRSDRWSPRSDIEKESITEKLLRNEIDTLVVVGGDGSLSATRELYDFVLQTGASINILGFPRTIDNDIRTSTFDGETEVAVCPGYPSAALKIANLTTQLRTTAMSSKRAFVIETMGRDSGWLAAACSLGGAEIVLLPEYRLNDTDWDRLVERIARFYVDQGHIIIGVSEGIYFDDEQIIDAAMGPRRLGGVGVDVAKRLNERLRMALGDRWNGIRYQQSGYIPRMGPPSAYDLNLASALGIKMQTMLKEKRSGEFPVVTTATNASELSNHLASRPLSEVEKSYFPIEAFYDSETFTIRHAGIDFLQTMTPEKGGGV
jgi:6-phosphofructokinase 1